LNINHAVVSTAFRSTDARLFSVTSDRACSLIHYADAQDYTRWRWIMLDLAASYRRRWFRGPVVVLYMNNVTGDRALVLKGPFSVFVSIMSPK
jgi:hypothetical protein